MLIEKIKTDLLNSRKSNNKVDALILSTLVSEIQRVNPKTPTDDEVQSVIKKSVKGLIEMVDRTNMAEYKHELELIRKYLPQQYTEEKLSEIIDSVISGGERNVGKIMSYLKSNHTGLYDGKTASEIIKNKLN